MISKLALGTVQFGVDYGINNQNGQVSFEEVKEILKICQKQGIDTIDTAHAYGTSEEVLGKIGMTNFKIVSKLPPSEKLNFDYLFQDSLKKLGVNSIYGYMLHNFSIYKNDNTIWDDLVRLKSQKLVEKIGVSLYNPEDLEILLSNEVELDIIQVPYNLFDRQFENYFPLLKERGVEIHTRSSFLQGLFFKKKKSLPTFFETLKPKFTFLEDFKNTNQLSTVEVCLGYVLQNKNVDKVVFGVDSLKQLNNNITTINSLSDDVNWSLLDELVVNDLNMINPSLWKL